MSINREASAIVEHTASFITFDQTNTWGQIGDATAEQQAFGYNSPNVQSAIDDLYSSARLPIGGIFLSLGSNSPEVAPTVTNSQTVALTITGNATANGSVVIDGRTVNFVTGDTPTIIASKIVAVLAADTLSFSSVTSSAGVVTYTYSDSEGHPIFKGTVSGSTFTSNVTTLGGDVGYLGYGSWQLLGSETKYTRTIYTWVRVG